MLRLRDGIYVYLTGWCGEDGWGVQDGAATIAYVDAPQWRDPSFFKVPKPLAKRTGVPEWDEEPTELNRYIEQQQIRRQ